MRNIKQVSKHRGGGFWIAISGLIGIAVLTVIVYALTVVRSSGNRDMDTPVRILPVGAVIPAGEGTAGPAVAIYDKACAACHDTGVANAPEFGDRAAWKPRMTQGIHRLLRTLIAGKGAMPPRGTCADCSDADLKATIEYMLVQVGYEPVVSARTGAARSVEGMPEATVGVGDPPRQPNDNERRKAADYRF